MNKTVITAALPAFLALAAPAARAQTEFEFDSGAERVVKSAPYCAEAVHETVQLLADAGGGAPNRIVRQQSTMLCRDGEGRTRQEVDRGGRKLVYLRDPVAQESWVLDAAKKTARRQGLRGNPGADSSAWREYGERMREWGRSVAERARGTAAAGSAPPTPPMPPTPPTPSTAVTPPVPPTPVVVSRSEGDPRRVEVNVVRLHDTADLPDLPPPAVLWRAQSFAPRGAGSVSPLPGKELDGVRVNGERTTWTIEAGKVGNERPIQITREVWTAPELMVTVSSRDFDPRSGEVNYRLKNLKRGEPDPALMRVPADFNKGGR